MVKHPMVLLVDDDQIHLLLLKNLFDTAGIEASCALNGKDALQEISANTFSCMITDLNMPCMDGLELAKKAKQLAPRMLIALCTGDNFPSVRWVAAEAGIDTVLTKPVNVREIMAMVFNAIQRKDQARVH